MVILPSIHLMHIFFCWVYQTENLFVLHIRIKKTKQKQTNKQKITKNNKKQNKKKLKQ